LHKGQAKGGIGYLAKKFLFKIFADKTIVYFLVIFVYIMNNITFSLSNWVVMSVRASATMGLNK